MLYAWSELSNAHHINWVLESVKSNRDVWIQARNQARDQAINQARDQARDQAINQARDQAINQAINQAREQAWFQARDQAYNQAEYQARGVLLALIAYDDCDQYLSMTYNELKVWATISETPQAILLLPMVYVKEQLNERGCILCLDGCN